MIINIGSLSSAVPLKEFSIYGATKRFVEFFSRAVAYEVKEAITLVTFLPGNTNTNQTLQEGFKEDSNSCISTQEFVSAALNELNSGYTAGHRDHKLEMLGISLLPTALASKISYAINNYSKKF